MTKLPLWTRTTASSAVQALETCGGEWYASGVSIDSRTLKPGDLFVALKGEYHDGHVFAHDALKNGAAAVCLSYRPPTLPPDVPCLIVKNTFKALCDLGKYKRIQSNAYIIGVTGSVGKTGTKEALFHVLQKQNITHRNIGNLNNHYGVPLSLARLPEDSHYGVFELGMSAAGEIMPLTQQVMPHVAVITEIAAVHLEFFASVQDIADAKAEIFLGMDNKGVAVLNIDNPYFTRLVTHAQTQGLKTILCFGEDVKADARLLSCDSDAQGSNVSATILGRKIHYRLGITGRHWVRNSLAVLLAVSAVGADVDRAADTLRDLHPPPGRGKHYRLRLPQGECLLIDESYNASPLSVTAAIKVLGTIKPPSQGRRIAVLGTMGELGPNAETFHQNLIHPLSHANIDRVFCCGTLMKSLYDTLPLHKQGAFREDSTSLAEILCQNVRAGDVILVKGSLYYSRMSNVVCLLCERFPPKDHST